MLYVCDKKTVKHLVEYSETLMEIPVRVAFQYQLDEGLFVEGSMEKDVLYNERVALKRIPILSAEKLQAEIEQLVDQALVEHLRYAGQASGRFELYPIAMGYDVPEEVAPDIYLPD